MMMVKPIEQTALSLLTDSFIDSSIVLPAVLGISIAAAGIYGICLLYRKFKTPTDSSNEGSDSTSSIQPAIDVLENPLSIDSGDIVIDNLLPWDIAELENIVPSIPFLELGVSDISSNFLWLSAISSLAISYPLIPKWGFSGLHAFQTPLNTSPTIFPYIVKTNINLSTLYFLDHIFKNNSDAIVSWFEILKLRDFCFNSDGKIQNLFYIPRLMIFFQHCYFYLDDETKELVQLAAREIFTNSKDGTKNFVHQFALIDYFLDYGDSISLDLFIHAFYKGVPSINEFNPMLHKLDIKGHKLLVNYIANTETAIYKAPFKPKYLLTFFNK
jgi:hypothetical protein